MNWKHFFFNQIIVVLIIVVVVKCEVKHDGELNIYFGLLVGQNKTIKIIFHYFLTSYGQNYQIIEK